MAKRIKRVYKVGEIAHLWAAFNRGDNTLDHARSPGLESRATKYAGAVYYSEGDICARQMTAKSKARYVLQIPWRKNGVRHAVGEKNGRFIELPHGAINGRYNSAGEFDNASVFEATDLTPVIPNIVKALIKGNSLRYITEARWLAKQERLSFPALLKEVLDRDETDLIGAEGRAHRQAQERADRLKREQEEAAQRAANDRNPLVRALRAVSQAALACEREARDVMVRAFGWTADLAWLVNGGGPRPVYRYVRDIQSPPTLLRVSGDQIHTSRGATFPAEHGLAAWPFILRAYQMREPWYPKATTGAALGHYRIDSVDADGMVHAGCHHVPFWSVAYAKARLDGWSHEDALTGACGLIEGRA